MAKKLTTNKVAKPKDPNAVCKRDFVDRNLSGQDNKKINWPREIKIAQKIFSEYPLEFLQKITVPFYIPSLAWF
jgi:hypothetical protein